jgi:hypothetical protein
VSGPDLDALFRRNNYRPPAVHEAQPLAPWLSDPALKREQLRNSRLRARAADVRAEYERTRMPSWLRAEAAQIRGRRRRAQEVIAGVRTGTSVSRAVAAGDRCGFCRTPFEDCQRCEGAVCGCGHLARPGRRSCSAGR